MSIQPAGTKRPRALTIAGSDCSGGAGIQADLKTFHRFEVYGSSAVTAVVAENSLGVQGVEEVSPAFVAMQIDSILDDIGADAAKTGMLSGRDTVRAVAAALSRHGPIPLVVDPVMCAKGGDPLIAPDAMDLLMSEIFPLAAVITPNVAEAEALCGRDLATDTDFRHAAEELLSLGPRAVIIKGGHRADGDPGRSKDVLWDGETWSVLSGDRYDTPHTHGTGCTFSAAITALLARGLPLREAASGAKVFIARAIASAPGLGGGHGPVNHWA